VANKGGKLEDGPGRTLEADQHTLQSFKNGF